MEADLPVEFGAELMSSSNFTNKQVSLIAAAVVFSGSSYTARSSVIQLAGQFQEWLDKDTNGE